MRFVLMALALRMSPCTSYPLKSNSSARYEPSCPVMPVTMVRCTILSLLPVLVFWADNTESSNRYHSASLPAPSPGLLRGPLNELEEFLGRFEHWSQVP